MNKTVGTLLVIGVVALLIVVAIRRGWIKWPSNASRTNIGTVNSSERVEAQTHAPENIITQPEAVQVDHTQQGYVLIPVDYYGNVVPQQMATQFIRYEHKGQDCEFQYRNRIYIVRVPTPAPAPESVAGA